ncbi:hypothetical protein M9458_036284 [Cirrhinus mrigala]|uniref:Arpin n=1 Tax=Cirrhinus mrigala TaxID=683832 RepID=A0ABD0P1S3_CIRMR
MCLNFAEVEAKGETDCLNERQLSDIVNKDQLVKITAKHCPSQAFAFWISEAELLKTELEPGQEVRLKTKGDGPFIFSFAKLDGGTVTKCNFAGDENAGASEEWRSGMGKIICSVEDVFCVLL